MTIMYHWIKIQVETLRTDGTSVSKDHHLTVYGSHASYKMQVQDEFTKLFQKAEQSILEDQKKFLEEIKKLEKAKKE